MLIIEIMNPCPFRFNVDSQKPWTFGVLMVKNLVDGITHFSLFTNRIIVGLTGSGDTTFDAYLSWSSGHYVQDALDCAPAMVSIKMENIGAFKGRGSM